MRPLFGRKALVVAHDELRLDLLDRIHGNADYDEKRGATGVEVKDEDHGVTMRNTVEQRGPIPPECD